MITPNRYAMYSRPAGKIAKPKTQLGILAHNLAQQTAITVLSVAATSGYVYALIENAAPNITFTDLPPSMQGKSTLAQLQGVYTSFMSQYAAFQGQAGAWINTQPGTATPSIFSRLVSVPTTLNDLNDTVTGNFVLLNSLTPGSQAYTNALNQQETLIGANQPAIRSLINSMTTLGTNLENAATALIASSKTGTLSQLLAAYKDDIATLNAAISSASDEIASDNAKIIGEGVGTATSITVGLVGLLNWWNPFGWIMIAGGAVGAYYAIIEIEYLKARVAELTYEINDDTNYRDNDQTAASLVSTFCQLLAGFSSMNQAAQKELLTLENLYNTLNTDITAALTDLTNNDLRDAQTEWTTILTEAQFLENLTAYIWPSPVMLSSPSSFAPVGNDIYSLSLSGELFHYTGGAWSDMGQTALSCTGFGTNLVAIDGAPINGTAVTPNPTTPTYFVKVYNISSQTWSTISNFPAAAVAVGGAGIFAINQLTSDRQVYQYSGSGSGWTKLTALPGPDAASQIAVTGGTVFVLANNSQFVYYYSTANNNWTQLTNFTCSKIAGNGNMLAVLGTDNTQYLYQPAASTTGTNTVQVAQLTTGDQYSIDINQNLWFTEAAQPTTHTKLAENVTGVFASDTNAVYYTDNAGDLYALGVSGTSIKLPAMP